MNFSAFYDDVLSDCSRATPQVALQAIRLAVREMCDKSRIWTYTTDEQPLVAEVSEYDVDLLIDSEAVEVLGAYCNDTWVDHKSQDWLDDHFGRWQSLTGFPRYVTHNTPSIAIVVPIPDDTIQDDDRIRFRVALRPTLTATSFDPESLFANDFYTEILSGAKARLMLSAGKPYSNLKLGEYHQKQWIAGINRARIAASRSRGRFSGSVEIPRTI